MLDGCITGAAKLNMTPTKTSFEDCLRNLMQPVRLWTRSALLSKPSPVPTRPGVYAWFFRNLHEFVPRTDCHTMGDLSLLYVGMAPVDSKSKRFLRSRLRDHLRKRSDCSTLRFSLGAILYEELNLQVTRRGPGKVYFGAHETLLSEWIETNALVTWYEIEQPWTIEAQLIGYLRPPLNLDSNESHPFHPTLSALRKGIRKRARQESCNPDLAE